MHLLHHQLVVYLLNFDLKNKAKVLERLVGVNTYKIRYRSQRLDAQKELSRLNKLGIITPSASPN